VTRWELTQEQAPKRGFLATGKSIIVKETPLALYKGLGAVLTGIIPKMAIRFSSYEAYKRMLADQEGHVNNTATFFGEYCHALQTKRD
jgi:solute carrier family 25 citrate transporter 1